jgi:hypothetical protein
VTLLVASYCPARSDSFTGQASIIGGDTLEIHGTRIRLWGIDAPESSQLCRGDDSLPYRRGAKADAPLSTSTLSLRQHNLGTLFAALYPAQNKTGPSREFCNASVDNLAGRSELARRA